MLSIIKMDCKHLDEVVSMMKEFYSSNAVDHNVEIDIIKQTAKDAVDDKILSLKGVILTDKINILGYAYITSFYSCECAGESVMLEELFIKSEFRGKGYGKEFFSWLFKEYPSAKRFRLEVTKCNENAMKLYKKIGFNNLNYLQMVYDR